MDSEQKDERRKRHIVEALIAALLVGCAVLVAFWQIMANRSRRAFDPFEITAQDFSDFHPRSPLWQVRRLPVKNDRLEPNILVFELRRKEKVAGERTQAVSGENRTLATRHSPLAASNDVAPGSLGELALPGTPVKPQTVPVRAPGTTSASENSTGLPLAASRLPLTSRGPIIVRLVHGYNMPDCMRLKGYTVELLADYEDRTVATRHSPLAASNDVAPGSLGELAPPGTPVKPQTVPVRTLGTTSASEGASGLPLSASRLPLLVQTWRLTSTSTGDISIWLTAMLDAGHFRQTMADVRSMAFPRIIGVEDPGWVPRGLTWASLRHPARNFRRFLRQEWNNSRSDLLTFLKLRRPAWASEEMLTVVTGWWGPSVRPQQEDEVAELLKAAYAFMLSELQEWNRQSLTDGKRGDVSHGGTGEHRE